MKNKFINLTILLALSCGLSGCVGKSQLVSADFSVSAPIESPTQEPVAVGRLEMLVPKGAKIGKMRTIFGISGDILAGIPNETVYRKIFYEELKKAGYKVIEELSVFGRKDLEQARFIIGGEIREQSTNMFMYFVKHRMETSYRINWRVYDNREKKEIYVTETSGAAKSPAISAEAVAEGLRVNFQRLLSDPGFIESLKS